MEEALTNLDFVAGKKSAYEGLNSHDFPIDKKDVTGDTGMHYITSNHVTLQSSLHDVT